jgi:hypothetical protein
MEIAMQIEILKFLLDASEHLQDVRRDAGTEQVDDLQAVERNLPDCDWFELGEEREVARRTAAALWPERGVELEF